MDTIQQIFTHPLYHEMYERLQRYERDRAYCRHDMSHFLDVARLTYITSLEQNLGLRKEVIYAAALLHDMGRVRQYEDGTHHDEAGVEFARQLFSHLSDLTLTAAEQEDILEAIRGHRRQGEGSESVLSKVLRVNDKKSRRCFECPVRSRCKWPDEKKNLTVGI